MKFEKPVTRRESIKQILRVSGCLALAGTAAFVPKSVESGQSTSAGNVFLVESVGETADYDVKELTRKTLEAAGGMSKFISKGDVVVIKPNISWARRPEMAASTNPYVMEAVVMLKSDAGNAGLVFRVNDPEAGNDRFRGYYAGFDTKTLYLGRMNPGWRELARFELKGLDCEVVPGVWNHLRVAVAGGRIRVWFNRMHPTSDKARGLRIDYTDKPAPVPSGALGVRAHRTEAWFDNVVVLPIDLLPGPEQPAP